jgi:hypothetical protein
MNSISSPSPSLDAWTYIGKKLRRIINNCISVDARVDDTKC